VRREVDADRIRRFLEALGRAAEGPGRVFLTGGSTAILQGWRGTTKDIDLGSQPVPADWLDHMLDRLALTSTE